MIQFVRLSSIGKYKNCQAGYHFLDSNLGPQLCVWVFSGNCRYVKKKLMIQFCKHFFSSSTVRKKSWGYNKKKRKWGNIKRGIWAKAHITKRGGIQVKKDTICWVLTKNTQTILFAKERWIALVKRRRWFQWFYYKLKMSLWNHDHSTKILNIFFWQLEKKNICLVLGMNFCQKSPRYELKGNF